MPIHLRTVRWISIVLLVLLVQSLDLNDRPNPSAVRAAPITRPRIGIVVKPSSHKGKVAAVLSDPTNQAATARPLIGITTGGSGGKDDDADEAVPVPKAKAFQSLPSHRKRALKLTRIEPRASGHGDALMFLQHHLNRANVRLSAIARRAPPADSDLTAALERRKRSLPDVLPRSSADPRQQLVLGGGRRVVGGSHSPNNLARRTAGRHGRLGYKITSETHPIPAERRLIGGLLDGFLDGGGSDKTASTTTTSSGPAPTGTNRTNSAVSPGSKAGYPQVNLDAATDGAITTAKPPSAADSLGLDIEANDVGYVATILIGSAQEPFRLLIDSGSADTWVAGTSCTGCGSSHKKLGTASSSSFRTSASKFSITYGTGAVSGTMGTDVVQIGGMRLPSHQLGIASVETKDFSDESVPFDGLMGLAKSELSNAGVPTPIDALFSAGLVESPVMGYHLARVADGRNGTSDGEVTFGGVDDSKFTGTLLEIPNISDQGFWEARLSGVSFNDVDLGLENRTAILDTGTTLIVAPKRDADLVHAAIPGSKPDGQGGYTIPCTISTSDGKGPTLALSFANQTFHIDTRDLTFLPVDQNNLDGECVSAISSGSVGLDNEWLVGAAFLKNVYFATNAKENVIGLAKLRKN